MYLNKNLAGLKLLELETHNYTMRIKHLLILKQKNNPPPWKNLATYWPTIDIYNYSKEYNS